MKKIHMTHFIKNLILGAVFVFTLAFIFCNFKALFPGLYRNALILYAGAENDPKDIPSSLNFLNDDKRAFIGYCQGIYGDRLPLSVDNASFVYFGTADGYRLYRLQANRVPCERVQNSETLAGYTFYSDCIYRPSRTGLYLIGDKGVFTLDSAYQNQLVDMSDVYSLYFAKIKADMPGPKPLKK